VTGGVPGKQILAGHDLISGTLELGALCRSAYFRVTVIDHNGGRVWTNPIWPGKSTGCATRHT
jgi:hypothetical protein